MDTNEYDQFILCFRIIINHLPYSSALNLSLVNKNCRRIFITKIKKITINDPSNSDEGFDHFISTLRASDFTIKMDVNRVLPYLPITVKRLFLTHPGKSINWRSLNKSPYIEEIDLGFSKEMDESVIENLPLSIRKLTIPNTITSSIDSLSVLPNLTHLIFSSAYHTYGRFNGRIDNLPSTLTSLTLAKPFDQTLDNLVNLPNLLYLSTGSRFNKPVENLPSSLKTLIFGFHFNQRVDNLPPNLNKLIFDHDFNQPIDNLPVGLNSLVFRYYWLGSKFNQPISHLPPDLTRIAFGKNFNQDIDNLLLPLILTHISFGNEFNKSISNLSKCPALRHLTLSEKYDQPLDYLPDIVPNLKHITFNKFNRQLPFLPRKLRYLTIDDGRFKVNAIKVDLELKDLPKKLTHLALVYCCRVPLATLPKSLKSLVLKCCHAIKVEYMPVGITTIQDRDGRVIGKS